MRKVLRMIFRNVEGRLVTLSLLDVDPEVTALQVETVMDSVVNRNIFTSSGGNLTEKVRAEVVTTDKIYEAA